MNWRSRWGQDSGVRYYVHESGPALENSSHSDEQSCLILPLQARGFTLLGKPLGALHSASPHWCQSAMLARLRLSSREKHALRIQSGNRLSVCHCCPVQSAFHPFMKGRCLEKCYEVFLPKATFLPFWPAPASSLHVLSQGKPCHFPSVSVYAELPKCRLLPLLSTPCP